MVFYDKDGEEIKNTEKLEALLTDKDYKIIKQDTTQDGKFISTVWLGLDYGISLYPGQKREKLIFETMVFKNGKSYESIYCKRYSTKEDATAGHEETLKKYNNN